MTNSAQAMDKMYRYQRYIYDATRKFYLLGRDELLENLHPPASSHVLEIGCGTARNLVHLAKRHPSIRAHGIDVSSEMLDTAKRAIAKAGLSDRIILAQADARSFNPSTLFGIGRFERIYLSYVLSMVPDWQQVVGQALDCLTDNGSLHIVEFGDQRDLPRAFGRVLHKWLAAFDVEPRADLNETIASLASARGMGWRSVSRFRSYSIHTVVVAPPYSGAVQPEVGRLAAA